MAQALVECSSSQSGQKPLTLTILPKAVVTVQPSAIPNHKINYSMDIKSNQSVNDISLSYKGYTPIVHPQISQISSMEKEIQRLERNKQYSQKFREKVKDYQKIALLPNPIERINAVLMLCYPELNEMNRHELNFKTSQFVHQLHTR